MGEEEEEAYEADLTENAEEIIEESFVLSPYLAQGY